MCDCIDENAAIEAVALRLLAQREHSHRELSRKLHARKLDPALIEPLLERLEAEGALDEARLTGHYVAERAEKGFGPLRIRAELREKGVSDALIESELDQWRERWPDQLARVHDRRFGPARAQDRAEMARRGRFLEQRGFPTDLIRRLLWRND